MACIFCKMPYVFPASDVPFFLCAQCAAEISVLWLVWCLQIPKMPEIRVEICRIEKSRVRLG